jgi:chaperonin cofactor prefoldin
MSELLQSAKDQKEFLSTMVQTDIELNEYRANVIAAKTKKEREEWGKLYTERLRALQAIRDPQLATIDKIIEDLTKASGILSEMIGEKNLTVKVNLEVKKTWDQFKEDLRILQRKKDLFGWDDTNIEAIKGEIKILEDVMGRVFEFKDKDLPLTDPQLLNTYARWQKLTAIVKEHEEENKKAARTVADVWNDLDKTLSDIGKKSQVFGKTYEDLEERAKATESAIIEAIELGSKLDTARIKAHKSELEIMNLVLDTRNKYNESLDETVGKALTLTDLWKKDYGVQNDIKNVMEEAQQILAKYTLQKENPFLAILDSKVGLEEIKAVLEKLKEKGLELTSVYQTLSKILSEMEVSKDIQDFNSQMADLNKRIELIGNDTDLLNEKLRLLKEEWRKLLKAPIEDEERYIELLKQKRKQIALTELQIELLNVKTQAMEDIFVGLGESIGKAMAGAEDAFSGLIDVFLGVVKKIGTTMISLGSILVFTKILSGLGLKLLLAGTAIVALSTAVSTSRSNASKSAEDRNKQISGWGMASGGVVPNGFPNDSYPAFLSSNEVVLPPPKKLPNYGNGEFTVKLPEGKWIIRGQDLHYIIKEMDRKYQGAYGS